MIIGSDAPRTLTSEFCPKMTPERSTLPKTIPLGKRCCPRFKKSRKVLFSE